MNTPLKSPVSTTSPSKLADWMELKALHSDDRNASWQDLVAELRRDKSLDALPREEDILEFSDSGDEVSPVIVDDTFFEMEDRFVSAGLGYPFIVNNQDRDRYIELRSSMNIGTSTYLFLLLLSYFGVDAAKLAQIYPERDFEEISLVAAKSYFGCNSHDGSYLFAFPRRTDEINFTEAVEELSRQLNEGRGAGDDPMASRQKDAHLDLVVWHGFSDRRAGQIIAFGQCTTAKNWRDKVHDLPSPIDWCRLWMLDTPTVSPVRMLFFPHRPDYDEWRGASILGGVLFDRCRISYHTPIIPDDLATRCSRWVDAVIKGNIIC